MKYNPRKAKSPIEVIEEGIIICSNDEHPENYICFFFGNNLRSN